MPHSGCTSTPTVADPSDTKSGPSVCLIYLPGSGALLAGIWVSSCLPVSPASCSLEDSCTHTLASQATPTLAAPSNTSTGSQLAIYPNPDPRLPYSLLAQTSQSLRVFPERSFPPICQLVQLEVCWWITHIHTEENTLVPSVADLRHVSPMTHGPSSCWHPDAQLLTPQTYGPLLLGVWPCCWHLSLSL